ncbi:class I SAM-dependent methyltransferase [Porticoccaceae bacterium]|jgi:methyltransferase (TIGR00027 family)|nr:class I SAM-dependent methyltransferase [Porticoccaceae bacterium]MDA8598647.1 class I SAM-dependent methyltransferase [Porticoccaceae bacterium]MDA8878440.1 class I SAM-dependent methyltransferase [Porticoccaceae bacterium]MDA9583479.1 class I SAM-dependent methyltransferase [Porticoccaceae bacterium]MDB2395121.1 class I SAM-dependent methyltransferase [Porticoccaceae bacterium]
MSESIFRKDATAQGVAKQRLIETLAEPEERIINDPYADRFVLGASVIKFMGHRLNVWLAQKLVPGFHEHLISRTRFIDDLVKKNSASGVEQYVILGAGYDSRAHRLELPSSLRIFEVDQPEVQARKRSKLPEELSNLENMTYVAVDFTHQTLTEQLINAGFDQNKSTVFTLEGVSQYITKEALSSTIKEVAALTQRASSTFFISYVSDLFDKNPEACFGKGYPNAEKRAKLIMYGSAKVGEPWISFYSAEEIENVLSQHGYSVKENVTMKDLNSRYFAPVGRALSENQLLQLEHFVMAESQN